MSNPAFEAMVARHADAAQSEQDDAHAEAMMNADDPEFADSAETEPGYGETWTWCGNCGGQAPVKEPCSFCGGESHLPREQWTFNRN